MKHNMSLNYRCRCFLFFFLLIQLMFGWIKVIPLLNTEQYAKQYNKVCLEKNTWIKNFRESKRFTLHILNTLILPAIILKIVAFHDFLLKAFWASQPANGWSNHGMRQFSKLWREGSIYLYAMWEKNIILKIIIQYILQNYYSNPNE